MPRDGYRLITTTYEYFPNFDKVLAEARRRRGQGKRTEIISEQEYAERAHELGPMQDLIALQKKHDSQKLQSL